MWKKLIERVKSLSKRTKFLLLEVFVVISFACATLVLACQSECGHVLREKIAEGILGGVFVGCLFALHKLATA